MSEQPSSTRTRSQPSKGVAVREVHLEHLEEDLAGLDGFNQAFVIFRLRGVVVGKDWLPIVNGKIPLADLHTSLEQTAWAVWQRCMTAGQNDGRALPSASVVVCTRDRPGDLASCLPSLQPLAEQGHEVIIVDNCPSDSQTESLVKAYPDFRYILEPVPGLNTARNRGLQAAQGEIVAFTDDDASIDPGWVDALLRNFRDPMVAVVTGIAMPIELETPAQRWFEQTNSFSRGFLRREFEAMRMVSLGSGVVGAGVNMAIRKSALEEIGYFDESLDGGTITLSGGDQEFFYRALAAGFRVVYDPSALVWHRHRKDWPALRRTVFGYGTGLFAWWTRALLVEREWTVLYRGPVWFLRYHVKNSLQALFNGSGRVPLDLAWLELCGALVGPYRYLVSRKRLNARLKRERTAGQAAALSPTGQGKGIL